VSESSTLFLGLIAVSVTVMALLQVGAVIALARYAKRVMTVTEDLQREIKPLIGRLNAIADEAHRATLMAGRQVDRVDHLVTDLTRRIAETSASLQATITGPVRQGTALIAGLRAVLAAFATSKRDTGFERDEEEDAMFVG
jgi:hypothetical protein